jgi:hypothetical protein
LGDALDAGTVLWSSRRFDFEFPTAGVGFFFIGAIGRALLGSRPVGFETLAMWGAWSSGAGLLIGIRFPKVTTFLLAPLMLIGG